MIFGAINGVVFYAQLERGIPLAFSVDTPSTRFMNPIGFQLNRSVSEITGVQKITGYLHKPPVVKSIANSNFDGVWVDHDYTVHALCGKQALPIANLMYPGTFIINSRQQYGITEELLLEYSNGPVEDFLEVVAKRAMQTSQTLSTFTAYTTHHINFAACMKLSADGEWAGINSLWKKITVGGGEVSRLTLDDLKPMSYENIVENSTTISVVECPKPEKLFIRYTVDGPRATMVGPYTDIASCTAEVKDICKNINLIASISGVTESMAEKLDKDYRDHPDAMFIELDLSMLSIEDSEDKAPEINHEGNKPMNQIKILIKLDIDDTDPTNVGISSGSLRTLDLCPTAVGDSRDNAVAEFQTPLLMVTEDNPLTQAQVDNLYRHTTVAGGENTYPFTVYVHDNVTFNPWHMDKYNRENKVMSNRLADMLAYSVEQYG